MKNKEDNLNLRLGGKNLYYMAAGFAVVIIGLIIMAWGPNSTVDTFESDIFSTRRIVVAPVIVFIGFVSIIFAIWVNPKNNEEIESSENLKQNSQVDKQKNRKK